MHAKSNPGMLTLDHGLFYQYALVDNAQTGKENWNSLQKMLKQEVTNIWHPDDWIGVTNHQRNIV